MTTTTETPLFTYSRWGFKFRVYGNRIETEKTGIGFLKKHETILLRSIASIEAPTMFAGLRIKTNDGKTHSIVLGTHRDEAHAAISALL